MSNKKSKKKTYNKLIIIPIIIFIVFVILGINLNKNHSKMEKELKKEGYETKNENDAFYKRIESNNTLDDYYNDISNHKDSMYSEYYLSKESHDFIGLKMIYQNEVYMVLNFTSNMKTLDINFTFEMEFDESRILLEGNNNMGFECNTILAKNTSQETIDYYCEDVHKEINEFVEKRSKLLSNPEIKKIIDEPITEVTE